ncbi:MAG: VTT domain-containing protein [Phycisphaerae bacterium]
MPVERSEYQPSNAQRSALWATLGAYFRRLGPAGPLAIIAMTCPVLGGFVMLAYIQPLSEWLRAHGDIGPFIYAGAFMVLGGLALMPTYAQSALGGWAFGFRIGAIGAVSGFACAAMVAYIIGRSASGNRVVEIISEHPRLKAVYDELLRSGFWKSLLIITLVRIPPNSPFAATNLILSATKTHPLAYFLGTAMGLTPRTCAVVYFASQLEHLDFEKLRNPWMLGIGMFVTLIVLGILGLLANRAIQHVTAGPPIGVGDAGSVMLAKPAATEPATP